MMKLNLCLLLLCSNYSLIFAAKVPIGKIEFVKGEALIAHLLKKKKPAVVGEEVFEKDKIKTGADGEVVITLADSKLTIGPNAYTKISNQKPMLIKYILLNIRKENLKCPHLNYINRLVSLKEHFFLTNI